MTIDLDAPTKLDLDKLQRNAEIIISMKSSQRHELDGKVWATHALELIAEVRRLQRFKQEYWDAIQEASHD